jgi:hypothetical protein
MEETLVEIERMKRRLLHFLSRGLKGSSQAAKDQNLKNMVALALDLFIKGKALRVHDMDTTWTLHGHYMDTIWTLHGHYMLILLTFHF